MRRCLFAAVLILASSAIADAGPLGLFGRDRCGRRSERRQSTAWSYQATSTTTASCGCAAVTQSMFQPGAGVVPGNAAPLPTERAPLPRQ